SLRLDVLAFRIIAARDEFTESTFFKDHLRLAALRTHLVQNNVRLLRSLRTGGDLPRRLALGITGAREELSEAAALQRHRLAAILARLRFGIFSGSFAAFFR